MNKLLYSQSTQQIYSYPRNDGLPIVGLDPNYLVLTEVPTPPPTDYNTETQSISDSWNVDVDSLEYRQVWTVTDLPDSPPAPNYPGFNLAFSMLPSLLQAEIIANQNHPSIVGKKDLAYSMIGAHGTEAFSLIFPLFCQAGMVDSATRSGWAALAQSFDMPQDFVDIIKGKLE